MDRNFPVVTIFWNVRTTSRKFRNFIPKKILFRSLLRSKFPEFLYELKAPLETRRWLRIEKGTVLKAQETRRISLVVLLLNYKTTKEVPRVPSAFYHSFPILVFTIPHKYKLLQFNELN